MTKSKKRINPFEGLRDVAIFPHSRIAIQKFNPLKPNLNRRIEGYEEYLKFMNELSEDYTPSIPEGMICIKRLDPTSDEDQETAKNRGFDSVEEFYEIVYDAYYTSVLNREVYDHFLAWSKTKMTKEELLKMPIVKRPRGNDKK